jgi:short-subunit dehydrogenase
MKSFKNKVVWVTGASSGIGLAFVEQLVLANAKVVLSARNEDKLLEIQKRLQLTDANSLVLPLDITSKEDFSEEVNRVIQHFGQIDVLINNAGISQRSGIDQTQFQVYKQLMEVNFFGTIALSLSVLPVFVKQNDGQFAVISSISGKLGSPKRAGYCASKHALHGFFDALRSEYFEKNIRVTMICPGYIQTEISLNALDFDGQKFNKADTNQKNGLSPETCAKRGLNAILQQKNEVYIGKKEVIGVYLKRFFPDLLARIVRNHAPR